MDLNCIINKLLEFSTVYKQTGFQINELITSYEK